MAKKIQESAEVPTLIKDVTVRSLPYQRMSSNWPMIEALMGGTKVIRSKGEAFLPKNTAESDKNYQNRLSMAILTPFYSKTVRNMAGRIFAKSPTISDAMDSRIRSWCENIDMTGKNLAVFAADAIAQSLAYGLGWILVDFPNVSPDETRTVADEKQSGARPYWVYLNVAQVTNVQIDPVKKVINLAVIREIVEETVGGVPQQIEQYRVLAPFSWELWRPDASSKGKEQRFALHQSGATTLGFVPLVPVYTGQTGMFEAEPPLLDLAYLNVAHYQGRSNQQNALTVAQFPILAATGYRPNKADDPQQGTGTLTLGPRKLLSSDDPQAKFYFVEHTGAAIEAGRKYLSDLADEMAMLGLQLLMPKSDGQAAVTATESSNRQTESVSDLERIAKKYQDALNLALIYSAAWVGSSTPGTITLNGRFDAPFGTTDQQTLLAMRSTGDITRGTLWNELQRRGVLSDNFDAKVEAELLGNEAPDLGGAF